MPPGVGRNARVHDRQQDQSLLRLPAGLPGSLATRVLRASAPFAAQTFATRDSHTRTHGWHQVMRTHSSILKVQCWACNSKRVSGGCVRAAVSTPPAQRRWPHMHTVALRLAVCEVHHHCCDVVHHALLLGQPALVGLIHKLGGGGRGTGRVRMQQQQQQVSKVRAGSVAGLRPGVQAGAS
jgi:hypothetical protein